MTAEYLQTGMMVEGGSGASFPLLAMTLPVTPAGLNTAPPQDIYPSPPAYAVPGNGVQSPPDTVPSQTTIVASGPPAPVQPLPPTEQADNWGWWLAAAVAGYLLLKPDSSHRAGTLGKAHKSIMPLVLVGGAAALYLISKSSSSTTAAPGTVYADSGSGSGGGAAPPADDPNKTALLQRYSGSPAQLAAINAADASTLRCWALIVSKWDAGWPASQIYGVGLDGVTPAAWTASLGSWWEKYSAAQHF